MNEQNDGLSVRAQAIAVGLATGLSLLFALAAPPFFPGYQPATLPAGAAFVWLAALAALLWVYLIVPPQQWLELLTSRKGDVAQGKSWRLFDLVALYVLVLACTTLLGWYTLASGGTLRSPFAGALLALALLSPFIANRWFTPVLVGVPVLAAYFIFSELFWPDLDAGVKVPAGMTFIMSVITTVIALGIAVIVKLRDERSSMHALATTDHPAESPAVDGISPGD